MNRDGPVADWAREGHSSGAAEMQAPAPAPVNVTVTVQCFVIGTCDWALPFLQPWPGHLAAGQHGSVAAADWEQLAFPGGQLAACQDG